MQRRETEWMGLHQNKITRSPTCLHESRFLVRVGSHQHVADFMRKNMRQEAALPTLPPTDHVSQSIVENGDPVSIAKWKRNRQCVGLACCGAFISTLIITPSFPHADGRIHVNVTPIFSKMAPACAWPGTPCCTASDGGGFHAHDHLPSAREWLCCERHFPAAKSRRAPAAAIVAPLNVVSIAACGLLSPLSWPS